MLHLRDRWTKRLTAYDSVKLHTSLRAGKACGIATVQIKGVDSETVTEHLWKQYRILVTTIKHPEFEGVRVSPHVYTTIEEIDRFCDVMEDIIKHGVPEA